MSVIKTVYKQVTATSGTALHTAIGTARLGTLDRLIVKQTTGTTAGFTVNVYDCDPDDPILDLDVHKVIGTLTVANGSATTSNFDMGAVYYNVEVSDTDATKRNKTQLYVSITAAGSGSKVFDIGLTYTAEP